jgi:undecaprenyl diphosphate synthase
MKKNIAKHVAIIMDGNGRWAKFKGKIRTEGHKEGANVVRKITEYCSKSNIEYLTLYAFSTENWNRPKSEVDFLMKLLESYLTKELDTYMANDVRFEVIGDMSRFSKKLNYAIQKLRDDTKNNSSLTQILAINYGSQDEISRCVKKLTELKIEPSIENITSHLDTGNVPPVDMLIRTGGEKRLSNFMLWQSAYAELFFTDTLWPDFCETELARVVDEFNHRERRFGKI